MKKQNVEQNFKTMGIWFAINKDDSVAMHLVEPTKNEKTGAWVSKQPFCNSILQNELKKIVSKAQLNFDSEPNYIEVKIPIQENK